MTDIKIIEGNAFELIKSVNDGSVQLIVTSPPYNLNKEYEKKASLKEYLVPMRKMAKHLHRVLKDTGNLCWQVGNYVDDGEIFPLDIFYYNIFKDLGFKLRNRIIWHFEHGLHCKNRLSGRYETILWFSKTDDYVFNLDSIRVPQKYPNKKYYRGDKKGQVSGNPLGKNPGDYWNDGVWNITNIKNNHPEKTEHPCQFPLELVNRCVLSLSNENDLVLDPFGGSGTTAVSCLMHERDAVLFEQDAKYVEIAFKRMNEISSAPPSQTLWD